MSDISPYGLMICLSVVTGLVVMCIFNIKQGVDKSTSIISVVAAPFFCLAGGLVLTSITTGFSASGFSSLGGLAGMYLAAWIVAYISRVQHYRRVMLESCTLTLPIMYSVSKIGCHAAGCCRGMEYSGSLSIQYSDHVQRFPVQMTESVVFLCIFIVGCVMCIKKFRYAADIIFQVSIFSKFFLDFLRESHTGIDLSVTQKLCLVCSAVQVLVTFKKSITPSYVFHSVTDITVSFLRTLNIRTLFLDLDNTLTRHNDQTVPDDVTDWIDTMRQAGIILVIVSNNSEERVKPFADRIGLPFVSDGKKPLSLGYNTAIHDFHIEKQQAAAVGDQLFTDILGAGFAGLTSFFVRPIEYETSAFFRVKRFLERMILPAVFR